MAGSKICEDLATVGLGKARIVVKTDQEPAIVDSQNAIARCRSDAGTALESSRVGDSNSNGKIERAIRKVKSLFGLSGPISRVNSMRIFTSSRRLSLGSSGTPPTP